MEEKKNSKSLYLNMFSKKEQPLANSINTEYTSKQESVASKSSNSSFDAEREKDKEGEDS